MRFLARLYALRLDRLAYRLWRYNPVALYRRYSHHAFDRRFGVTTRGYSDLRYEPSPAPVLERTLGALSIDPSEFVFVDIGSGKGKVVLLASTYPFKKVIGVELEEEFHRVAEENLRRFPEDRRLSGGVFLECIDAAEYRFPSEPSVVYFFNPFSEDILAKVLENLEASIDEHPRPLYVIFYAPILFRKTPWDRRRLFDRSARLEIVQSERDFTIYRAAVGPRDFSSSSSFFSGS